MMGAGAWDHLTPVVSQKSLGNMSAWTAARWFWISVGSSNRLSTAYGVDKLSVTSRGKTMTCSCHAQKSMLIERRLHTVVQTVVRLRAKETMGRADHCHARMVS